MDIGERLREERERLGYNQTDFAGICGKSKNSQIAWENGDAFPNAKYLVAIANAGADVNYILTGQRSGQRRGYDGNPRIQAIVALLEELNDDGLSTVRDAVEKEKQIAELKTELAKLKAG
jgi:transcriptional regulator with XRE-family HTH domain